MKDKVNRRKRHVNPDQMPVRKHKGMRHVEHDQARQQGHLVAAALELLGNFGVEILMIDFRKSCPVISVAHTSGVERVRHQSSGQGVDKRGHYVWQVAHVCGCFVEWDEVIG